MFVKRIVKDFLSNQFPQMHSARRAIFSEAVQAAAEHRVLSLTGLGRHVTSSKTTKLAIKSMDRLVGNPHLHNERRDLYAVFARYAIGQERQPIVLVDWTGIRAGGELYALRFAVPFHGRTVTIYEAVYHRSELDKAVTIRTVLSALAKLLPAHCVPILILDAGFKNPWFNAIQAQGWHWLARIRGLTTYRLAKQETWQPCRDLYATVNAKARAIGVVSLAKTNPLSCSLHLYKGTPPKQRKKKSRAKSKNTNVIKARKRAQEPWLLAASLSLTNMASKAVVSLYRKRMQIEEGFRDTKARNGWRFAEMRSNSVARILGIPSFIPAKIIFSRQP